MKKYFIIAFFAMTVLASSYITPAIAPAIAQTQTNNNAPIDISADQALEWDRVGARYIARGNARAIQGDTTIKAETLTAYYNAAEGNNALSEIHADQNVEIISGTATVFGDAAIYNLTTEIARVTGDALQMTHENITVTAQESFEYDARNNTITATGRARAQQDDKTLESQRLIAYLIENREGQMEINRIEAPQKVTITTARETAIGNRGVYDVSAERATLFGDVQLTQDRNTLEGARAEVNMNTGQSRLFAAENQSGMPGRVRGVFYPSTEN